MSAILLFLAMAADSLDAGSSAQLPTEGLLSAENIYCVSRQVTPDQAEKYYALAYKGKEIEAFESAAEFTKSCQQEHDWSETDTRNAFRISILDGWLIKERVIAQIEALGEFKPLLEELFQKYAPDGDHNSFDADGVMENVRMDLSGQGYPQDDDTIELALHYWEWRSAVADIEKDFVAHRLRHI